MKYKVLDYSSDKFSFPESLLLGKFTYISLVILELTDKKHKLLVLGNLPCVQLYVVS